MTNHDVVAIGASAGGFQALRELAKGLPGDFPAALLVTIHLHPEASKVLPDLVDRAGRCRRASPRTARRSRPAASISRRPICICSSMRGA